MKLKCLVLLLLCAFHSLRSADLQINDEALAKVVQVIWGHYLTSLAKAVDVEIFGTEPLHDRSFFTTELMEQALSQPNVKIASALGNPAGTAVVRDTLGRVMSMLAVEYKGSDLTVALEPMLLARACDDLLSDNSVDVNVKKDFLEDLIRAFEATLKAIKQPEVVNDTAMYVRSTVFNDKYSSFLKKDSYVASPIKDIFNRSSIFSNVASYGITLEGQIPHFIRYVTLVLEKLQGNTEAIEALSRLQQCYKVLFPKPTDFNWCGCSLAPLAKRVALVVRMTNDILVRFKPGKKPLVYVSLASGDLLLDFLIIKELQHHGYKNIDINFIEFDLVGRKELEEQLKLASDEFEKERAMDSDQDRKKAAHLHQEIMHDKERLERLRRREPQHEALDLTVNSFATQKAFETRIGANYLWSQDRIEEKSKYQAKGAPGIFITTWENINHYIAFARCHSRFKADVVLLTDPSPGIFSVDTPREANSFALVEVEERAGKAQKPASDTEDEPYLNKPTIYCAKSPVKGFEIYTNLGKRYDIVWISDIYVGFMEIVWYAAKKDALLYQLNITSQNLANEGVLKVFTVEEYKKRPAISPTTQDELISNRSYVSSAISETPPAPVAATSSSWLQGASRSAGKKIEEQPTEDSERKQIALDAARILAGTR